MACRLQNVFCEIISKVTVILSLENNIHANKNNYFTSIQDEHIIDK